MSSTGSTAVRVTDDSTREEVAQVMSRVNAAAKMGPPVVGRSDRPTLWDRRHELLNAMLTDWQSRPHPAPPPVPSGDLL